MATNQKQQLIVIAIGLVAAGYMGYTTLFPDVTSQYASQAGVTDGTEGGSQLMMVQEEATIDDNMTTIDEPAKVETCRSSLSPKVEEAILAWYESQSQTRPLEADLSSKALVLQSKNIIDATMAATLREQNQKHQMETHHQLGIQAPMAAPATVVSSSPKQTSYPVYLFRLEDGPTIARIKYKEQWIKVHPGMELGPIKVLRITSKGVTVREDGKTRLLTPRDS